MSKESVTDITNFEDRNINMISSEITYRILLFPYWEIIFVYIYAQEEHGINTLPGFLQRKRIYVY